MFVFFFLSFALVASALVIPHNHTSQALQPRELGARHFNIMLYRWPELGCKGQEIGDAGLSGELIGDGRCYRWPDGIVFSACKCQQH
jgi:hypothetical protein